MRPLKICMVTTFYPPYNFGGDGIFVSRLVNALARDGHEVHVVHDRDAYAFCARDLPDADKILAQPVAQNEGIFVHTLGSKNGAGFSADLLLAHQLGRPVGKEKELEALLNDNFDVVHFHNISLLGGPHLLKLGRGLKLCTLHDHWFVCAMHALWRFDREACTQRTCLTCTVAGGRPPQLWRYTGAVEEAVKHVDAFIAPSQFARESHLRNGFPAPIRVLPHFIPDQFRQGVSVGDTQQQHHRPYFLYAGRLEKLKGVQFLIEQFRRFADADLLIAGHGVYEDNLRAAAAGLTNIHFLGEVASERLNALYQGAVAAVIPSLCYETFGLVALEAFAQGTPAIVNDLGALPETASGGGALVYRSGDELVTAMKRLLSDPELRRQMAKEGLANLEANYTEQRHMSGYYGMISELSGARKMQEV